MTKPAQWQRRAGDGRRGKGSRSGRDIGESDDGGWDGNSAAPLRASWAMPLRRPAHAVTYRAGGGGTCNRGSCLSGAFGDGPLRRAGPIGEAVGVRAPLRCGEGELRFEWTWCNAWIRSVLLTDERMSSKRDCNRATQAMKSAKEWQDASKRPTE